LPKDCGLDGDQDHKQERYSSYDCVFKFHRYIPSLF